MSWKTISEATVIDFEKAKKRLRKKHDREREEAMMRHPSSGVAKVFLPETDEEAEAHMREHPHLFPVDFEPSSSAMVDHAASHENGESGSADLEKRHVHLLRDEDD